MRFLWQREYCDEICSTQLFVGAAMMDDQVLEHMEINFNFDSREPEDNNSEVFGSSSYLVDGGLPRNSRPVPCHPNEWAHNFDLAK
jgi:hypothetical protein